MNFVDASTSIPAAPSAALQAGGDERLRVDPRSGRNVYGLALDAEAYEVHLGSSTASSLSRRARASVDEAWRSWTARASATQWFDEIRGRILAYCGDPDADCILTPSGTHAELVALAIASACSSRPITNIMLAPEETGRGVLIAAGGAHFLDSAPFAGEVRKGARLAGWESADIRTERVEIRRPDGGLRPAAEVDEEVAARASRALGQGRSALVHLLDVSKTGGSALSLGAARRIRGLAPDRSFVLADCCQLRSSPSRLRELANSGFLVAVTGSKFAGGPPFSGALIAPRGLLERMEAALLPAGLGAHSARLDWPSGIAAKLATKMTSDANLGLGLRWSAALAEMERFRAVATEVVDEIQMRFVRATQRGVAKVRGSSLLQPQPSSADFAATILPIILRKAGGAALTQSEAEAVQRALRQPIEGDPSGHARAFHVGQPVEIGREFALRVCLSAPLINEVADRIDAGKTVSRAFAPLAQDLTDLFDKWTWIWKTCGFAE